MKLTLSRTAAAVWPRPTQDAAAEVTSSQKRAESTSEKTPVRYTETGSLGELLNGCKILILQDEKSSKDWLYNNVNVLNITELYT